MSGLACWVPGGLMALAGLLPEIVLQREPLELRQGPVLDSTLELSYLHAMTLALSAAAAYFVLVCQWWTLEVSALIRE